MILKFKELGFKICDYIKAYPKIFENNLFNEAEYSDKYELNFFKPITSLSFLWVD